ncbi:hypothetical protein [Stagnihabitans tardus]|uniref:Type IV pilus biogenesis protein PilP n=1 Tax=Stagnihabitans tardus TaxID=2699202 RepID=A0AAE4Y894_9RHOB|nr:hypothetical protein [Stagnihabitans tardus]NBZ87796.1 hypothetical protein [Stagnihabitans tardus]
MKPTFALDFRDGQVTLLHRTSRGWSLVGSAAFGAPDFDETLAYLRSTAMGLSPRGITTKLILPNEQILYTDVDVGASDGSRRRRLIRLALEGRTPYAVDDLAWDWSGEGPTVKVAVIAKETLAEAEGFAAQHRFNPVSFVSVPEAGTFDGEPFFGPTALAPQVLGEADKVERDSEPVQVILREAPKPEPGPAITEADLAPPVVDARDLEAEAEAVESPVTEPEAAGEVPATGDLFGQAAEPAAAAPVAEPAPVAAPDLIAAMSKVAAEAPARSADPKPSASQPSASHPPASQPAEPKPRDESPQALADEAPMALDVMADPAVEDDLPPPVAPAIAAALAGRKAGSEPVEPPKTEAEPRNIGGVSRPGVARPAMAKPPAKAETLAFPSKGGKPVKGKSAGVTATTIPGIPRREKNVVTLPTPATAEGAEAAPKPARPQTVIKGRTPIGGKPRYLGVILTVALLLLLAGVAVWSSFFMGTGEVTEPSSGTPLDSNAASLSAPAETQGATETAAAPAATETAAAPAQETAVESAPAAAPATETAAASPEAPAAAPATEVAAAAPDTTLSTLSAPRAGAAPQGDAIRLSAADTPPGVSAPQALGPLAAGVDSQPAAPPAPPPFGTVYKFDANGLIIPTPEGIMSPEGVLLVAGKPARVPPQRPAELTADLPVVAAPDPVAPPTETATPGAGASTLTTAAAVEPQDPAPIADPALAGKRPAARPAGLVAPETTPKISPEAAPAVDDQQGALAPAPTAEELRLAALRPAARPDGLTLPEAPAVEEPAPAANNASLVASGAPLLTAPVTRAPRPPVRPTDLNRAVDEAVTAALDQPEAPAQEVVQDEPEPDNRAPDLPTNASVAKQATTKDALNTNKLALLAVFGTPSNRFAMVRQPNGAVKKVRVGDRLDGGSIAAITANSVQYQKGGRMVTLALPTG